MSHPPVPENGHAAPESLTVPDRIGKYVLQGVAGQGSMGVVYRAVDPDADRQVALKTIRRDLLEDEDAETHLARFRTEARAAGGLEHPGIAAVVEYGEEREFAYLALEYVEGRTLRECFEQRHGIGVADAADIASQLLEALQYAHERGVWHRDVKPANILVTSAGRVKLTDFGIAHIKSSTQPDPGEILGTAGFVAPELYLGDSFDGRVDLFAAGAVLYQMLSGVPAYVGTADQIMVKVCYETPVPPSTVRSWPALRPFDAIVMRALARRPEDRFATAAEFRDALRQAR